MNKNKKIAFSLIELLVVIVIIGILSGIGISSFNGFMANARDARRQATVKDISKILNFHYISETDVTPYFDLNKEKLEYLFSKEKFACSVWIAILSPLNFA